MATSKAQKNTNAARRKRTYSKVAARAQLDERSGAGVQDRLEERAKEQEKTQQRELRDGVATGQEKQAAQARAERAEVDPASARAGGPLTSPHAPGVQGGFVDQLSARPGQNDVFEGHFCRIDLNTGYPLTARVRLRDDTHEVVVVPYAALRPAQAGGR
jgi:hypothetical protein